jgi:hypothetical protein
MLFRPLLALSAPLLVSAQGAPAPARVQFAQVTVRERIMIRVRPPRRAAPAASATVWSERRAYRCIPVETLAGAAVSQGGDIDLMLTDGRRLRAKLGEDCPSLSFYSGFYLRPGRDGRLCGGRDVLRARSGGICPILRFRMLEARR